MRGEWSVLVPTVTLEGHGRVPCEVVRVLRPVAVQVREVDALGNGHTREVWHHTALVRLPGEDADRTVGIERVRLDDGSPLTREPEPPPAPVPPPKPRSRSHRVVVGGVVHRSLAKACAATGVPYETALWRMQRRGQSAQKAATTPINPRLSRS